MEEKQYVEFIEIQKFHMGYHSIDADFGHGPHAAARNRRRSLQIPEGKRDNQGRVHLNVAKKV